MKVLESTAVEEKSNFQDKVRGKYLVLLVVNSFTFCWDTPAIYILKQAWKEGRSLATSDKKWPLLFLYGSAYLQYSWRLVLKLSDDSSFCQESKALRCWARSCTFSNFWCPGSIKEVVGNLTWTKKNEAEGESSEQDLMGRAVDRKHLARREQGNNTAQNGSRMWLKETSLPKIHRRTQCRGLQDCLCRGLQTQQTSLKPSGKAGGPNWRKLDFSSFLLFFELN